MAKANKIAEGHYRTNDGLYEIVQQDARWFVSERRSNRYVIVAEAKTLTAAEKELARITKTDEEAPEILPEEPTEES